MQDHLTQCIVSFFLTPHLIGITPSKSVNPELSCLPMQRTVSSLLEHLLYKSILKNPNFQEMWWDKVYVNT